MGLGQVVVVHSGASFPRLVDHAHVSDAVRTPARGIAHDGGCSAAVVRSPEPEVRGARHITRYNPCVEEVRRLRLAAGLTQAELAARSGVAQPNIAAYESGQRTPSAAMLSRLRLAAPPRPSAVLAEKHAQILATAKEHKAENVRVFGSVARGEDTSGSDLDLLVTLAPDATVFDLAELIVELEDLTGLRVDVISERGLRPGSTIRDEAVAL